MANPFCTEDMAVGYATSRPAVHPRVIEQVYRRLGRTGPFQLALDVGCGAGVSTRALTGFARSCIGLEPTEAMLKWASMIAPSAGFVVGTAEAIPLCDHSVDLITAAGSLNYANLDLFFPEAARVRMMTETNVAAAVRSGVPHSQIKSWCAETLAPVWNGPEREVQFRGYFACMSAA